MISYKNSIQDKKENYDTVFKSNDKMNDLKIQRPYNNNGTIPEPTVQPDNLIKTDFDDKTNYKSLRPDIIRGAIFDIDGVILDSLIIWEDLGARYLQHCGIQPEEGLNEILFSMSMEQGAAYLKTHYPLGQSEDQIMSGIEAMLEEFYVHEVLEKPGCRNVLAFLQEQGIRMAAATSSPRNHVTEALKRLGLLSYFEAIFTTSEVGKSKHDPLIYKVAADAIQTAPEETYVFEDSLYALKTAKDAGFRTLGVYDAHGESDQEGMRRTAEIYLLNMKDFVHLLS